VGSQDTYYPGEDDDETEYSDYDMQQFFNDRDVVAGKDHVPFHPERVATRDRRGSEDEPYEEDGEGEESRRGSMESVSHSIGSNLGNEMDDEKIQ
jgi:hypothetical protein